MSQSWTFDIKIKYHSSFDSLGTHRVLRSGTRLHYRILSQPFIGNILRNDVTKTSKKKEKKLASLSFSKGLWTWPSLTATTKTIESVDDGWKEEWMNSRMNNEPRWKDSDWLRWRVGNGRWRRDSPAPPCTAAWIHWQIGRSPMPRAAPGFWQLHPVQLIDLKNKNE